MLVVVAVARSDGRKAGGAPMNRLLDISMTIFAWFCTLFLLPAVGAVFVFLILQGGGHY